MVAVLLLPEGDAEVPRPVGGVARIDELDPRHKILDIDPYRHNRGRAHFLHEIVRYGDLPAELRRRCGEKLGKRRRVNGDARLECSSKVKPGKRPDFEFAEGNGAIRGGVFSEKPAPTKMSPPSARAERSSSLTSRSLNAKYPVSPVATTSMVSEPVGLVSKSATDPPVITSPSPSFKYHVPAESTTSRNCSSPPLSRNPSPISHIPRAGSGFANSARA